MEIVLNSLWSGAVWSSRK